MRSQGRKEVQEAVLIAALSTVATALITWALDEAKRKVEAVRAKKQKRKKTK